MPSVLRTPERLPQCWADGGAEPTAHGELGCDCGRRPGPCAFPWVTPPGPRRGKEKEPYWEEERVSPYREMESKAPEPTPGQIRSIQDSPWLGNKPVGFTVDTDAEHSGLDEALKRINAQFRVLSFPLEKNLPMWLFFGEGGRKWLFSKPGGFCGEVEAWVQVP